MATGQGVGDFLANAAGASINRPAMNAAVDGSIANNGYRTAQTDVAIGTAIRDKSENDARDRLGDAIKNTLGPDGTPLFNESEANLATQSYLSQHGGKAADGIDAVEALQKAHNLKVLSDKAKLNTADQTAAAQGVKGGLLEPTAASDTMVVPTGVTPNIVQTPHGAAVTQDVVSQSKLRDAQTAQGGFRPPTTASDPGVDGPNVVSFGGYKLFKTGTMPPVGQGASAAGLRKGMIAEAARLSQLDPTHPDVNNAGYDNAIANGQDFTGAQRAVNSFAGGPIGNQVRALNNTVGHLQLMENLFSALQNGDTQMVNKLGNSWNRAFGSAAPTDVQTAANVIGPELTKILTNTNAGTGEERGQFAQTAGNLANSPEQTAGAIGTLKGMLGRQGADLALQYHGATGRGDFSRRYLQPDVAKYLELDEGGQQGSAPGALPTPATPTGAGPAKTPSASAGPAKIQGDEEYNKLPSGAHFIGPDGHERIKP